MSEPKSGRRAWSLRRKLLFGTIIAVVVLGLALGLGLGLGLNKDGGDGDNDEESHGSLPVPTPSNSSHWKPSVGDAWQIILSGIIELSSNASEVTPDVAIFDIDLFNTPKETIDALHRLGKKVICYFSAGSYEPGRPDSNEFEQADLGKELDGWPGERWLQLKSDSVKNIVRKRIELAHEKGCDGVDPDNVDGYQNENGFDLTAEDSIAFMTYLYNVTAPLNLTLGLKNAGDIIDKILPLVDFSVNEQCVQYKECSTFAAFIEAGKPVFHIEYPEDAGSELKTETVDRYCGNGDDATKLAKFSTVLKKMDLDGWVENCEHKVEMTATKETKE